MNRPRPHIQRGSTKSCITNEAGLLPAEIPLVVFRELCKELDRRVVFQQVISQKSKILVIYEFARGLQQSTSVGSGMGGKR